MQLFAGVIGPTPLATPVHARLVEAMRRSNPDTFIAEVRSGGGGSAALIGHRSRAFLHWSSPDGATDLFVDGRLRLDGRRIGPERDDGGAASLADRVRRDPRGVWDALDGSFCLVVREGPRVTIGCDTAGSRSVYWWLDDGVLAFGSHLVDVAAALPMAGSTDLASIGFFLASGSYPPGRTALRELGHVGAGQVLTASDGRAVLQEHFSLSFAGRRDRLTEAEAASGLSSRLRAAVTTALGEAQRPVFPLSGGVDSRYLVAEAARIAPAGEVPTITWGVDPDRAGGDAVVAREVARRLGLPHAWLEKVQRLSDDAYPRALYLSSGEADCAIHYPQDHELHASLAEAHGSLFRGDESFGNGPLLLTRRAAFPANGILLLRLDGAYARLLSREAFASMADEQLDLLGAASLRSSTPTGRRDEVDYAYRTRRVLAAYNRVKLADLEVFTPLQDRPVLEFMRHVPDRLRDDKLLFRRLLASEHPALADVPTATRSNLPRWAERYRTDPELPRFLLERVARPGWLDEVGARTALEAALRGMTDAATAGSATGRAPEADEAPLWRRMVRGTWPGRLVREMTMDRRNVRAIPAYLRCARLSVVHELLGLVRERRTGGEAEWTA